MTLAKKLRLWYNTHIETKKENKTMTNREYFEKSEKSVKEMMRLFNESKEKSFDEWLNKNRTAFSKDILYVDEDCNEVTGDEVKPGRKYIAIHVVDANLRRNDADFYVRIADLSGKNSLEERKWCDESPLEYDEDIPLMEDGVIDGYKVTKDVVEQDKMSYPAFKYASKQKFYVKDGRADGFLGSVFQFRALWKHSDEIREVFGMLDIPFKMMDLGYVWTCTLYSAPGAWLWNTSGNWNVYGKTNTYSVVPFFAIR